MRRALAWETVIVLGLSLGKSGIYSILSLTRKLLAGPLREQTTSLNTSRVPEQPWIDLAYQLAGIVFPLVPVLACCYLLAHVHTPPEGWVSGLGMEWGWRQIGGGVGLAALIGIPGLAFYIGARAIGINTTVAAANLAENWWTVPVYVLVAFGNGLLEEIVMIGYLLCRWRQAGMATWHAVALSALIRGSYHLYQGFGGFIGNVVMGAVFGAVYAKTKKVWPLVIAHGLIDVAAYLGYSVLAGRVGWL